MIHLLNDIGIAIVVATAAGYTAFRLKQPIILAYFLAGVIIGPEIGPPLIRDHESIEIISEIGLILLLFIIGLEMNPETILSVAKRLVIPGLGQFLLTAAAGFALFSLATGFLPFSPLENLYLAIGISLSSTAIVIKLLHDKYELDSIAGRITVGILIFQDIWAILVIVLQPRFDHPSLLPILAALLKAAAMVTGGMLVSKYLLRRIFESITRNPEMVVIVSIGWCALVAGVAHAIGLSTEMGALIAGVSISSFPYSTHVSVKILPLRDFFLTLFFISLGMKIAMPEPELLYIVPLVILVTFLSRFLILYPLLRIAGSGSRNAFIASLNLSQISEFSLVIITLGISLGHVGRGLMSLMIYSMAFMAILSSYLVRFNNEIFLLFSRRRGDVAGGEDKFTKGGERGSISETEAKPDGARDIYILGYHRGARALVEHLKRFHPEAIERIVVVDYNQEVVKELKGQGIQCIYGDVSNDESLKHSHIDRARFVISTIPDFLLRGIDNRSLVKICRRLNPGAFIIANAELPDRIRPIMAAGADYVVLPYATLAREIASIVVNPDQTRDILNDLEAEGGLWWGA